ncbi:MULTISPECIES: hypothetical protein [unclassified Microcoleus]|nr:MULTISPECIES: hypothetical protein [unclassified Microcoleus]
MPPTDSATGATGETPVPQIQPQARRLCHLQIHCDINVIVEDN